MWHIKERIGSNWVCLDNRSTFSRATKLGGRWFTRVLFVERFSLDIIGVMTAKRES